MKEKSKNQNKKQEVNIFTFIKQIYTKERTHKYDKELAPKVLLCYWMSHDARLLGMINNLNRLLFNLSDEQVYEYFMNKVPKGFKFLKWTKKEKNGKKEAIIKKVMINHNVSKKEAIKIVAEGGK